MRIRRKFPSLSVLAGVSFTLLTGFSPHAHAELITFGFKGVVTDVGNGFGFLDSSIFVGSEIVGSYTFDTRVMSPYGYYAFSEPPNGIHVDIGNYRFQSDLLTSDFRIDITNNGDGVVGNDVYLVRSQSNKAIGPPLDIRIGENSWWLKDPVGDPFSSTELPTMPPVPSQWGFNYFLIQGFDPHRQSPVSALIYIVGRVTSLFVIPTRILTPIDIRPGSDTNEVNPMSDGLLPVTVFGSPTFDVLDVDKATIGFGPDDAPLAHRNGPHFEDIDADGYLDLITHFRVKETGIAVGEAKACFTARLANGSEIEGCDSIRTVPK